MEALAASNQFKSASVRLVVGCSTEAPEDGSSSEWAVQKALWGRASACCSKCAWWCCKRLATCCWVTARLPRRLVGRRWGLCWSVVMGRSVDEVCLAAVVRGCLFVRLVARVGWRHLALVVLGGTLRRWARAGWCGFLIGPGGPTGGTLRQVAGSTLRLGGGGSTVGLGAGGVAVAG